MEEKTGLKLARAKNIECTSEDDYRLVVTMLMLRQAFISVGHFFTRYVKSGVEFDFDASLSGVYDAFRFKKYADEAKTAGEKLFNFLLTRGKDAYQCDHFRIKYVLDDAGKVNPDATILIFHFVQEGFSEKVIKFAMDIWKYQKSDEFFLTPFWGRIIVNAKLFVQRKLRKDEFSIFREGQIRFEFKVNGDTYEGNWVIGDNYNPMRVTYAFPGWINIEQERIDNEAEDPLIFPFSEIFNPEQTEMKDITVNAVDSKTREAIPDWRATLRFGSVRGDLTLVPSLN